jgi:hypothetical protein
MVTESKPEIEPDQSFEEWLRKTVELLCAKRAPLFRFESELRLCQLKAWLLDDAKDLISVRQTAMTFAAAMIGRRMARIRPKHPHESPTHFPPNIRLMIAVIDANYGSLLNFAFPPPRHLYSLYTSYSFKQVSDWAAADADKIRCLNELTRWACRKFFGVDRLVISVLTKSLRPDSV